MLSMKGSALISNSSVVFVFGEVRVRGGKGKINVIKSKVRSFKIS